MTTFKYDEALRWKHDNINQGQGIRTHGNEITEWPFGDMPTQAEVNQWEAEWLAFNADPVNSETTLDDVIRAMEDGDPGFDARLDAAKRSR